MPTVAELTAPYGNYLIPVRAVGPGVCSICRTSVVGAYLNCWQCNEAIRRLPSTADAVAVISLALKGDQLAYELSGYKNSSSLAARERMTFGLAAVLWRWLGSHELASLTRRGPTGSTSSLSFRLPGREVELIR